MRLRAINPTRDLQRDDKGAKRAHPNIDARVDAENDPFEVVTVSSGDAIDLENVYLYSLLATAAITVLIAAFIRFRWNHRIRDFLCEKGSRKRKGNDPDFYEKMKRRDYIIDNLKVEKLDKRRESLGPVKKPIFIEIDDDTDMVSSAAASRGLGLGQVGDSSMLDMVSVASSVTNDVESRNPTSSFHNNENKPTTVGKSMLRQSMVMLTSMFTGNVGGDDIEIDRCGICLIPFEGDDEICSSRHSIECKHAFHKECIVEWLMDTENCPVCDNTFMVPQADRNKTRERASAKTNQGYAGVSVASSAGSTNPDGVSVPMKRADSYELGDMSAMIIQQGTDQKNEPSHPMDMQSVNLELEEMGDFDE